MHKLPIMRPLPGVQLVWGTARKTGSEKIGVKSGEEKNMFP